MSQKSKFQQNSTLTVVHFEEIIVGPLFQFALFVNKNHHLLYLKLQIQFSISIFNARSIKLDGIKPKNIQVHDLTQCFVQLEYALVQLNRPQRKSQMELAFADS